RRQHAVLLVVLISENKRGACAPNIVHVLARKSRELVIRTRRRVAQRASHFRKLLQSCGVIHGRSRNFRSACVRLASSAAWCRRLLRLMLLGLLRERGRRETQR